MITLSPAKDDYKEGLLPQSRAALEAMQAGYVGFSTKRVVNLGDLPSTLFFPSWKVWKGLLTGSRVPRPDCWSRWWDFGVGSAQTQGHCCPRPGLAKQQQTTSPQQSGAPHGPSSSVCKHRTKWVPRITHCTYVLRGRAAYDKEHVRLLVAGFQEIQVNGS